MTNKERFLKLVSEDDTQILIEIKNRIKKRMTQTAMQLAIEHYENLSLNGSNQAYVVAKFLKENFLEIEKQQIINAVDGFPIEHRNILGDEYYEKTFNK